LLCFGFFLVKCLVCSLLSVSLDYPLSVASSAFSYVYFDTFHTQSNASAKFSNSLLAYFCTHTTPFSILFLPSAINCIQDYYYLILSLLYIYIGVTVLCFATFI
jgi:hypothetical protein